MTNGSGSNYTAFFVNATLGRVGIGTASPKSTLDLAVSGIADNGGIRISNSLGGSSNGLAFLSGTDSPWMDITEGQEFRIKGNTYANLGTWNNGANTKFIINSAGNVGINTTAPAQTLTVQGTLKVSNPGTSGQLYMNSAGNVGIGTTSPSSTLTVIGNITTSQTNNSIGNFTTGQFNSTCAGFKFGSTGGWILSCAP